MSQLYSAMSDNSEGRYCFSNDIKPVIEELSCGMKVPFCVEYTTMKQENLINSCISQDKSCCVVCFSGGKDSVATAIKCRDMGYDVKLYHVHGINHSYYDEAERAKEIACHLKMPLHIENIALSGKSTVNENPVKNQLICTMALDWSDANGYGHRIAVGDFKKDHRENAVFGTNWTDTVEMWEAYEKYIRTYYDDFELIAPFDNYFQTMEIVSQDKELLEMVQGCISPSRYREYWRKKNIEKYGDVLLPHRCGSCWKCCIEYIYLSEHGIIEKNDAFYKKCSDVVKKKKAEM